MTITNHIRRIEDLAELVIEYVDEKRYREAHNAINSIEERARLAHEHIDHLQAVTPNSLISSGD